MSSIIRTGNTFHGISVDGRGVFTNARDGPVRTYAGQCKDGYRDACGLGVTTYSSGSKVYAEHGPDGQYDGRCLGRFASGHTFYCLYERGKSKAYAHVFAAGTCEYNGVACAPDDPRVLALIAQVTPVEVRPAAPAPQPNTQTPSNRPTDQPALLARAPAGAREGHGHPGRGASPRRTVTPSLMAVRDSPTTGAMQRTTTH
jgi:hypothetical protein